RINGRAAGYGGVLGVLAGMDVQRWNRDRATTQAAVLAGEDPLALVHIAGVVKSAGEDIVIAEPGRELVPRRPRYGAARAREIDRRRLSVPRLVEVERPGESRARARAAPDGAVAAGGPLSAR